MLAKFRDEFMTQLLQAVMYELSIGPEQTTGAKISDAK